MKHALLVIDLQNDYFPDGLWPLHNIEQAAQNASKILEHVRTQDDLVIHVRHEFESEQAPFFLPHSDGAKIHASVLPKSDEPVVLKHQVNSFLNTNLQELLEQNSIGKLTIIGAMTHMCIDAATRAASDLGYQVTVVEDACASKDLEHDGQKTSTIDVHNAYLAALGFAYADITTTQEFING